METTERKLVKLDLDHTVVDAFNPLDECCIHQIAETFVSAPGSQARCGICENRMRGVLAKSLAMPRAGADFACLGPYSLQFPDLEPQELFFAQKSYSGDKINYIAEKHSLPFDAYRETSYGSFLMLKPGEWFDPGTVVPRKLLKGIVSIFAVRKAEFKDEERPEATEFKLGPIWWE